MSQSVYQKILGEDFHKLGPSLQFSHGSEKFVKASGPIDVIYGKNIFVRWLNKLSKMPPEGVQQNVVLTIERNAKQEVWTRDFNGKIFRTIQFEKNGYLIERDRDRFP